MENKKNTTKYATRDELSRELLDTYLQLLGIVTRLRPLFDAEMERNQKRRTIKQKYYPIC